MSAHKGRGQQAETDGVVDARMGLWDHDLS